MDVGTTNADETSFDIDVLAETDSVLVKNATSVRWLYKNETGQLVVLEKARPTVSVGSYIEQEGSVGRLSESNRITSKTVARLLKPYSREGTPREVIVGTEVLLAYLQTVKLI